MHTHTLTTVPARATLKHRPRASAFSLPWNQTATKGFCPMPSDSPACMCWCIDVDVRDNRQQTEQQKNEHTCTRTADSLHEAANEEQSEHVLWRSNGANQLTEQRNQRKQQHRRGHAPSDQKTKKKQIKMNKSDHKTRIDITCPWGCRPTQGTRCSAAPRPSTTNWTEHHSTRARVASGFWALTAHPTRNICKQD